jgi:hypothetical protein
LADARREVEINRSIGIYRPTNLGSIVTAAAHQKLDELESLSENTRERQNILDFLYRLLPIVKVLVLEELLEERISLSGYIVLGYESIADQFKQGGGLSIKSASTVAHELMQIRPTHSVAPLIAAVPTPPPVNADPSNATNPQPPATTNNMNSFVTSSEEDDDELHFCAVCKYVLFNSRRTCTSCKGFDVCDYCYYTQSSKVHPHHKFKLMRKASFDSLLDLVDSIKNFIGDHEPPEAEIALAIANQASAPPSSSTRSGRKRDHFEMVGSDSGRPSSPNERLQPGSPNSSFDEEVIDCICGNNKDLGFMISCEKCYAWLHGKCVGISKRNEPEVYYCPRCEKKPIANIPPPPLPVAKLAPRNMSPEEKLKEYRLN